MWMDRIIIFLVKSCKWPYGFSHAILWDLMLCVRTTISYYHNKIYLNVCKTDYILTVWCFIGHFELSWLRKNDCFLRISLVLNKMYCYRLKQKCGTMCSVQSMCCERGSATTTPNLSSVSGNLTKLQLFLCWLALMTILNGTGSKW